MNIRKAVPDDAERLLQLMNEVDDSNLMLYGPGERKTSTEQMQLRIEAMNKVELSEILVAESGGKLAGYLMMIGNQQARIKHSIYLVVGVGSRFRGKGAGTMLLEAMEHWARQHHIHRIELTVIAHNETAFSLYKKMGFQVEGTKNDSLTIDGQYVDEYYMSKLI
ncbi:GNAT family N-acetyltransferase [Peribacillus glennii]|uniref:GNAT family N-acetyltransferase n=2 Tax=Peribacillus glennii TaxID=2303991 RepID=A0A372LI22_9BACI|nr:GNAT family N-acetyltransferase [Peribacillus glennii]